MRGLRTGLVTNHTGRTLDDRPSATALLDAGADVTALFAPEHGLLGNAAPGEPVRDTSDEVTGIPVYSLYGATPGPDPGTLADLDVLVFDIQDVGARYYSYVSTMLEVMRAASAAGLPFIVADRPNPIGGRAVQGNVLDPSFESFVGPLPIPMRHGMTVGELALLANGETGAGAELHVLRAEGWERGSWGDETGIAWVPTSPNMPSIESATHYPGTCLFEGTPMSVGRGTDRPFQQLGAPWLDGAALVAILQRLDLPGVRFEAVRFRPIAPDDGKFDGEEVSGIRLFVTDRSSYDPTTTSVHLLVEIRRMAGPEWVWREAAFDRLAGTDRLRMAIEAGHAADLIVDSWPAALDGFARVRSRYLLY